MAQLLDNLSKKYKEDIVELKSHSEGYARELERV
jgi:hypothetical protein